MTREKYRLVIDNETGELKILSDEDWQTRLFDTKDYRTNHSGQGWCIFVISSEGNLYVGSHDDEKGFAHSMFTGGQPVKAAGELFVKDGILLAVTPKSGHYKPTSEDLIKGLKRLQEQGLNLFQAKVNVWDLSSSGAFNIWDFVWCNYDKLTESVKGEMLAFSHERILELSYEELKEIRERLTKIEFQLLSDVEQFKDTHQMYLYQWYEAVDYINSNGQNKVSLYTEALEGKEGKLYLLDHEKDELITVSKHEKLWAKKKYKGLVFTQKDEQTRTIKGFSDKKIDNLISEQIEPKRKDIESLLQSKKRAEEKRIAQEAEIKKIEERIANISDEEKRQAEEKFRKLREQIMNNTKIAHKFKQIQISAFKRKLVPWLV